MMLPIDKRWESAMRRLLRRLRVWLRGTKFHDELKEEIEFHRAMKREEFEHGGLSRENSVIASNRSMGNVVIAGEDSRGVWIWPVLEHFYQDVHYAFRTFRKTPAFTLGAIVSLAVGIGANSLAFSFVNAML